MVDFKKPLLNNQNKKPDVDEFNVTLFSLINNPTGSNSAHVASRRLIKDALNSKVGLLLNEKRFHLNIYYDKSRKLYIYHTKVPSERDFGADKLHYDVVFEVSEDDKGSIMNGDLKVFSNSPSFIYTYANVVYNMGIIPKWLKVKMNKLSIKKEPVVKNPDNSLGFEKSIYFAISYIKTQKYDKIKNISNYVKPFNKNILFTIKSFDDKVDESKLLTKKMSDLKKKTNSKEKKKRTPIKHTKAPKKSKATKKRRK